MAKFLYYYDDRVIYDAGKLIKTKSGEKDPKIILALETTTLDTIIDNIIFASSQDKMSILRILAHGRPGKSYLGKDGISEITVDKFKKLKGYFLEGGRIELHSCSVAKFCTSGVQCTLGGWLQKLADYTGVSVTAAQITQIADDNWEWEGMTSTFNPWKPGDSALLGTYTP